MHYILVKSVYVPARSLRSLRNNNMQENVIWLSSLPRKSNSSSSFELLCNCRPNCPHFHIAMTYIILILRDLSFIAPSLSIFSAKRSNFACFWFLAPMLRSSMRFRCLRENPAKLNQKQQCHSLTHRAIHELRRARLK